MNIQEYILWDYLKKWKQLNIHKEENGQIILQLIKWLKLKKNIHIHRVQKYNVRKKL